jgi:hypothetical protein
MSERKFLYSHTGDIVRTIIADDDEPKFHVHHAQDVEPVLDSIHRDREIMAQNGVNRHTHRIPAVIYEQLQLQGIADDPDLFKAWLNSSDADPWRIWWGKRV